MTAGVSDSPVIWHDVECGAYEADLPLWEELAEAAGGPVLELGCGTGRVALHLARHGNEVTGIDNDGALIAALRERASGEDLAVRGELAEAGSFSLDQRFALIIAPMQLIQLLPDAGARGQCLRAMAAHLRPAGIAALSIVDEMRTGVPSSPLLPDVRELDGWVYSSLPIGANLEDDSLLIERLRQSVDPDGHLEESRDRLRLRLLSAAALEDEGRAVGLTPAGRRSIASTEAHVGSTVVLLEGR